ncbi:MAG: hypothetical protein COA86_02510 [Kangiella sp.]|nr:MAG: hypothetical protein COA86_02510 [Kangiella sp.]
MFQQSHFQEIQFKENQFQEIGIISSVDDKIARIITKNQLACGSCQLSDSCGNGLIEKYLSGKVFESQLINTLNAKVGEQVVIEIPISSVTKASLISYFVPILGLFVFALIGESVSNMFLFEYFGIESESNQFVTIMFALIGLFTGFMITKYYNHKSKYHEQYQIKMVRIVSPIES